MLLLQSRLDLNADDDEVFDLEDSEDFSCTSEDSSEEERSKNHKRRKSLSLSLKAEGESDVDPSENYDEDEVALQQAIALSMAGKNRAPCEAFFVP